MWNLLLTCCVGTLNPIQAVAVAFSQGPGDAELRSASVFPRCVRAATEARQPKRTSHVEFAVTYYAAPIVERAVVGGDARDRAAALVERRPIAVAPRDSPVTERFTSEGIQGTVRQISWGTALAFRATDYEEASAQFRWENEGSKTADGVQARAIARHERPRSALAADGALWSQDGDPLAAEVVPLDAASHLGFPASVLDLFALGTAPMIASEVLMYNVDASLGIPGGYAHLPWESGSRSDRREGAFRVETLALEHAGVNYRLDWCIDETKDSQPVRATLWDNGRAICSCATSLRQAGGRWFPQTVEFYRDDFARGLAPYLAIQVEDVSFDEPWHRQEPFGPDDIGLVVGTQVRVGLPDYANVGSRLGFANIIYWDGVQLIPADDYWAMIYLYGLEPDPSVLDGLVEGTKRTRKDQLDSWKAIAPSFRKKWQEAYGPREILLRANRDVVDDWDAYVREFMAKHNLSEGRKESAEQLLKHLKGLRDYHEDKYREALAKAEAAGQKELAAKYREPVDKMFSALKRGLLRLIPPSERKKG